MCMQNFVKIYQTVQEIAPVSLFSEFEFLIDYDEVRIKSQPKEEISRSAVYTKYTSLQSMEY